MYVNKWICFSFLLLLLLWIWNFFRFGNLNVLFSFGLKFERKKWKKKQNKKFLVSEKSVKSTPYGKHGQRLTKLYFTKIKYCILEFSLAPSERPSLCTHIIRSHSFLLALALYIFFSSLHSTRCRMCECVFACIELTTIAAAAAATSTTMAAVVIVLCIEWRLLLHTNGNTYKAHTDTRKERGSLVSKRVRTA